jgi:hypothetical protein
MESPLSLSATLEELWARNQRGDSITEGWFFLTDFGQTNEQQRHFDE